jgi:hypothetical protein
MWFDGTRTRTALCALLAASTVAWDRPVFAVDKVACVDAAESGQRLRKEGQLVSARNRLLVCASPDCPEVVSQDCTGWLGEVQRSLASVTVKAHNSKGEALSNVTVSLDGAELPERAPTATIEVDPGDHVFRCERAGFEPGEQRARLAEGERDREIDCRLTSLAPSAGSGTRSQALFEVPGPPSSNPGQIPWTVWPLAGVGVVGLGSFAFFGLTGQADEDALRASHCAPYCDLEKVDSIRTKFLIADISLAVGIVALGAGAIVALLNTAGSPASKSPGANATR